MSKIKFKDPKNLKATKFWNATVCCCTLHFSSFFFLFFFCFFLFFLLFYFWFCCRCWCSLKFGDTLIVASIILQKRVQWFLVYIFDDDDNYVPIWNMFKITLKQVFLLRNTWFFCNKIFLVIVFFCRRNNNVIKN